MIAPLYALTRYAAAIDARYEPYANGLGVFYMDEAGRRRRGELTAAGGIGCLAVFAFLAGLAMLTVGGWPISGMLIIIACIAVWCGEAFRERHKSVVSGKPPMGEKTVALNCPKCNGVGFVKPDKVAQIRCGNCGGTFEADSTKRALPAWLAAGVLAVIWTVTTQPWQVGFVPPERLVVTSLLTWGLASLWRFVKDLQRREKSTRGIDFAVLDEMRTVLLTIAAGSFVFWCLNEYLSGLVDPRRRDVTVHWVQLSLRRADELLEWFEHWKVALWPAITAIVLGLILVRTHRIDLAKRTFARRKDASKVLKRVSLVALTLSSFSLAGASTMGTLLETAQYGLRSLGEKVNRDLKSASVALDAAVVMASVVEKVPPDLVWPTDCRVKDDQSSCPAKVLQAIDQEVGRADALRRNWPDPNTAARAPIPSEPRAPSPLGIGDVRPDIEAAASRADSVDGAPHPAETVTHVDFHAFGSMTIGDLEAATAAIDGVSTAPTDPASEQRKEMVGLVVDIAFDLLKIDPGKFLKGPYGDLATKIAGSAIGGPKKVFQEAVRDGLLSVARACRGGPSACRRAAEDSVARVRAKAGSQRFVQAVADRAVGIAKSVEGALVGLQQRNEASQAALDRLRAPILAKAKSDRWEKMKSEWDDISPASEKGRRDIRDLERDWDLAKPDIALAAAASGRKAPKGGWDLAFLDFLRSNPDHARTVANMALRLAHPNKLSDETLDQAYRRFAGEIDPFTLSTPNPRDRQVLDSPRFRPPPPPPSVFWPGGGDQGGGRPPGPERGPIEVRPAPHPASHGI